MRVTAIPGSLHFWRTIGAGGERASRWRDALFLAVAVVLSFASYGPRLGFYSDDWAFLGLYASAAEQSVAGFYEASMSSQHAMRPVQVWLCAVLYALFGLEPLGYHLFNGALLVANAVLVYAIARELRAARLIALAVALTYALLPSYSTDRFWFVAFAIVLSMTACLASIYAGLRVVAASPRVALAWAVVSPVALLISALSYEVALPLFLLLPILVGWRLLWQTQGFQPRQRLVVVAAVLAIDLVVLAGAVAFKLGTTVRLGADAGVAAQVGDIVRHAIRVDLPDGHYGLNIFSALRVHFGDAGVRLPATAWHLVQDAPAGVLVLTVAFGLFTFSYLAMVARRADWPPVRQWLALMLAGIVVFGLGYAIFLTNYNVQFTPTGIANRSAIGAALGAAMIIVGSIGLTLTPLPARIVPVALAALITVVASCGFVVINAVAQRWVEAYEIEQRVLSSIQRRFPSMPSHSALILDGVCPYVGPAVVFESNWDLAGALQVMYRDATLSADVVTPRLEIGEEGITTTIYGFAETYPYSEKLLVYNVASGVAKPLPDVASAREYFLRSARDEACPAAQEGIGVRIF